MTRILANVFLGLALTLAVIGSAQSQDKVDPGVAKIRYSGLGGFSPSYFHDQLGKPENVEAITIDGVTIKKKEYKLKKPVFVSTELCSGTEADKTLQPFMEDDEFYRVKEFAVYASGTNLFAYEVEYEFFDGKSGEEIGATRAEFYIDENGSGVFPINCGVKEFKMNKLPDWIKSL